MRCTVSKRSSARWVSVPPSTVLLVRSGGSHVLFHCFCHSKKVIVLNKSRGPMRRAWDRMKDLATEHSWASVAKDKRTETMRRTQKLTVLWLGLLMCCWVNTLMISGVDIDDFGLALFRAVWRAFTGEIVVSTDSALCVHHCV